MQSRGTRSAIFFLYGEDGLRNMNGSISPVPIRMKRKLRIDPLGLLRMRSALERWRPDCLHCHGYYAAAAALFLRASGLGSPIVYTVHAERLPAAFRNRTS